MSKGLGATMNWCETLAKIILYVVIMLLAELLFVGAMAGLFNKVFGW